MQSPFRFSSAVQELLRCPICQSEINLRVDDQMFACTNPECAVSFPIVDGVPVLVNEAASLFDIASFTGKHSTTYDLRPRNAIRRALDVLTPDISRNIKTRANYTEFVRLLMDQSARPQILVLGGSVLGKDMDPLMSNPAMELVETDVSFGPRTALICDAHNIPFAEGSFDGVVAQAVLEHVLDPYRCVAEIYRVLKPGGLVYAETPFMQQVHMGRYDFTRFTHLGLLRLFRWFSEIDSGAVCGPGMALAWSYRYFLASFTTRRSIRYLAKLISAWSTFWLKYLDGYLIDKPGALDAASGYYFLGRKAGNALLDRELIKAYRGALVGY